VANAVGRGYRPISCAGSGEPETSIRNRALNHDADGNTTTYDQGHTLVYDAWNRLVQVKSGSTVIASYGYDAASRRISETHGSVTTQLYVSAADQVLVEWDQTTWVTNYWDPVATDELTLRIVDNFDTGTSTMTYGLTNANGDVAAVYGAISTSGVQERYAYDPYGQVTFYTPSLSSSSSTSSIGWEYLHQGLRWDSVVDLYDNRARAYSPTLMRFLQNDPIGFGAGDQNTYRYESDGPAGRLDPFGLQVRADPGAPSQGPPVPPTKFDPNNPFAPYDPFVIDHPELVPQENKNGQQIAIEYLQDKMDKAHCEKCTPEEKEKAKQVIKELIEASNFDWSGHTLGPTGECNLWVEEYMGVTPAKLKRDIDSVKDCLEFQGPVSWRSYLGMVGGPAGGGGLGAGLGYGLTVGTSVGGPVGAVVVGAVGAGIGYWKYGNAGHNGIGVKLCDGTQFYLNDGYYGAGHVFYDVPPWYGEAKPYKCGGS
jgi:RHS repeat-associated protein